jgi:hypothetical protein
VDLAVEIWILSNKKIEIKLGPVEAYSGSWYSVSCASAFRYIGASCPFKNTILTGTYISRATTQIRMSNALLLRNAN